MAISINDWLQSEALRHALDLQALTNNVAGKVLAVLNRADGRLYAALLEALDRLDPSYFSVERLESLLASVRAINTEVYDAATATLLNETRSFVAYEASYQAQMLRQAMPIAVSVASIDAGSAYAAAMARPFQGVLLRGVLKDLDAGRAKLIRQTVAQGFVESKTTAQIVSELRGTRAKGYADGLMQRPRREIDAVVRTAMGHMAGFMQDKTVEANADLIAAVVWQSTIDISTSAPCRARDQKRYTPVDHKPIGHSMPWGAGPGRYHWCCRSHQAIVTKSWRELGVDMDEVPAGTRASMDGQIPAEQTYLQWLELQSAARQDDVLGKTRGALYRTGKLPMDRMYDHKGRFLDLAALRERVAAAFAAAGL